MSKLTQSLGLAKPSYQEVHDASYWHKLIDALDAAIPRYRDSIFQGLPVIATRGNGFSVNVGNQSNGTDTSANFRTKHIITTTSTDIRFVIGNHFAANSPSPNAITVQIGVENPTVGSIGNGGQVGSILRVTFRGSETATLDPGAFLISDPVPMTVVAGQLLYLHTYVSVASIGMKWPLDLYTLSSDWEGATRGAPAANLSQTSGIAQTTEPAYSPVAILGTPVAGRPPVVALVGDSITYGSGDTTNAIGGYAARALTAASIGYMQISKPGEQATSIATISAFEKRMMMTAGCTHALEMYGHNDYASARTLAQVQADKLALATYYSTRGIKVWTGTLTPGTTSTDSWATTTNQTAVSGEAVRLTINAWIRAGLPIDPTTKAAVAIGTAGALLAGNTGHPYVGYFEIADTVESARDSGKWKAPSYTADGTHPTGTGHVAMAAAIDITRFV